MIRRFAAALAAAAAAVLTLGLAPALAGTTASADGPRVLAMLRLPAAHARAGGGDVGGYGDGAERSALRRAAGALARKNGLIFVDDWPMPVLGVDCVVLAIPDGRPVEAVARRLEGEPGVAWSQPMNLYSARAAAAAPSPRLYLAQPAAREWRLAELHHVATGRGVRVALIDSAVDQAHPDLVGQVALARNFVAGPAEAAERHGTAVAGVIAARGVGVTGVAPGARLEALRACWQQPADAGRPGATVCDSLSLARALEFTLQHPPQVINLSLSGPPDLLVGRLIDLATRQKVAVVAAFDPTLPRGGFPASHPGVIPVAAEAAGPEPAGVYAAPGRDVPTTTPDGRWGLVSGSSFAAAHVSGLIALLRERRPGGAPTLAVSRASGAVDACATLLGADRTCAPATASAAARR